MKEILLEIRFVAKTLFGSSFYIFLAHEGKRFFNFLKIYSHDKVLIFSNAFEEIKNVMVKSVLIKRGKRNRMFLHVSAMTVLTVGAIFSPLITDANLFKESSNLSFAQSVGGSESSIATEDVFNTESSEKPRDKVLSYTVQNGDTLATISKKFGISVETIKWANDLKSDTITSGDNLQILPVTGIAHRVVRGDTVYSIAKKYSSNAQGIVDFPFNDFANPQTFSLVEGQILIVPEGVKPEEAPRFIRPRYIAAGPIEVSSGGFTWPVRGSINQGFFWYHKGIDIGGPVGTPVVAASSGRVSEVYNSGWNGGYGIHVIINGDNGYATLYSHMSGTNVSPGDLVAAGKSVIGWIGMTGRTTGPHLHFEVRGGGSFLNPLSVVQ